MVLALIAWNAAAFAQPPVRDDFESGELDWGVWCPCQINLKDSPVTIPADHEPPGDRIARIVADDASLGGNKCRRSECRPPAGSALHVFSLPYSAGIQPPRIRLHRKHPRWRSNHRRARRAFSSRNP